MLPKVSIVIPTYNRTELLKESIESVINQDYTNIEIIVIDDCSEIDTYSYLKENFGDRIVFYRNKINSGGAYSRNKGVELASGEFISFLDSDDTIDKSKISKLVNEALKSNADFVYSGWVWKDFEMGTVRVQRIPDPKSGLIFGKPRWCYNIIPELVKKKYM